MQIEIINVTPALAKEWLGKNSKNRPVRKQHVKNLAGAFERGEYVMTHQGVAFGSDGELIDGQHRLSAIAQLPEGHSFPMLVAKDMDRDTTFEVVDTSAKVRSVADALHVDRRIAEVGTFLARIACSRSAGLTPKIVKPFAEYAASEVADLVAFCPTAARIWSTVPVRAAAVIAMKLHDAEYAKHVYRAMILAHFDEMPTAAQALFRAGLNGGLVTTQSYDVFVRALRVFNPVNAHLTKITIKNQSNTIAEVRDFLINETKKKAPELSLRAKGVSALNSNRAVA